MADNTGIEWADSTWNPITGCSKVSAGCTNCYAEKVSHRFGFTNKPWNAAYAAENVKLHPERLEQPLRWTRPRKIFVNSMSDLFHEQVPFEFIDKVFAVMALSSQHTFQILTKRPERMAEYFKSWFTRHKIAHHAREWSGKHHPQGHECDPDVCNMEFPLKNVWIGVSVENQEAADKRIPLLLETPAALRFLSCEPLLGPVDLKPCICMDGMSCNKSNWLYHHYCPDNKIDWVIVGGESGPNARPMHPDWARSLRDQCVSAGISYFFKQFGEWAPVHELKCNEPGIKGKPWFNFDPDTSLCRIGKRMAGRELDGRTWDEFPPGAKER